jgi:stearoyl-CoA desaturase (delta-9 desaturase)
MHELGTTPDRGRGFLRTYFNAGSIPFWAVHLAAIAGVLYLGWSFTGLWLALGFYAARMFFLTAGYHRYFSHRSYKTSRWFQLVLALGGQTCAQMGALWWASNHRAHHKHSDEPEDLHSPKQRGFWWAHIGWFLDGRHEATDLSRIQDFARYPELRWLNRREIGLLPPVLMALACWAVGGLWGLTWGFFVSTVLLWHGTFTINSLSHLIGRRRFRTADDSRNNFVLALITLGEGWHNNHHQYQSSAAQGFRWYEIDISLYLLRGLAALGIVWDLRPKPTLAQEAHAEQQATRQSTRQAS